MPVPAMSVIAMSVHTRTQWITKLKAKYSFYRTYSSLKAADPSDPYAKAMDTFQAFTNDIVAALHKRDMVICSYTEPNGPLEQIYRDLPPFYKYEAFRDWVKKATLKHPQRRTAKEDQWLKIVSVLEHKKDIGLATIIGMADGLLWAWEREALAVSNLERDPRDAPYFFRTHNGIRSAEGNEEDFGESCFICAEDFDIRQHPPQKGPCGHVQCGQCFEHMLSNVGAEIRCSFCRGCLVCGQQSCPHHRIKPEAAPPYPLPTILEHQHLLRTDWCWKTVPLHGITPKRYWALREDTRRDRVTLTRVVSLLAQNLSPEHRAVVAQDYNTLMASLWARILVAARDNPWTLAGFRHLGQEKTEE